MTWNRVLSWLRLFLLAIFLPLEYFNAVMGNWWTLAFHTFGGYCALTMPGAEWLHFGHKEAEMYRAGLTFYRYYGRRTTQWYVVLLVPARLGAFKARVGLVRENCDLRWERYLDRLHFITPEECWFDYENRFTNVGDLGWLWPMSYYFDSSIFWARWDRMYLGESDLTRLGRWLRPETRKK